MTEYVYSIDRDFPNRKVATDRLTLEIQQSSIVTALDHIDTDGDKCLIFFKADLSDDDKATLDGVVARHSGEPLPQTAPPSLLVTPSGAPLAQTRDNKLVSAFWPTEGNAVTLITPNWCDRRTWWQNSIRVDDEVVPATVPTLEYTLAFAPVIDTYHGRITQEDFLKDADGKTYRVLVSVNGVLKTEQDPSLGTGGDYLIDYTTGKIMFLAPIGLTDVVTATYHKSNGSTYSFGPAKGKVLHIASVETQFSQDFVMTDTVRFQPWGLVEAFAPQYLKANGGPYDPGTKIPLGNPSVYKTMLDFVNEATGAYPLVKAVGGENWRGLVSDMQVFPWNYKALKDLYSSKGMEIRISLVHDIPFKGAACTAAFYCLSDDE